MTLRTAHPLRLWRVSHELSGNDLADRCGVNINVIYSLERWERVRLDLCQKVVDEVGIPLAILIPQGPSAVWRGKNAAAIRNGTGT